MSEIFLKVLNMSISATYLVLAVLLLRLLIKKAPKWVSVLLWGIVAVRLICPVSIESILSLVPSGETVSPEIMMDWTPEIQTGISSLDSVVNPVISETFAPDPLTSANPLQILIPVAAVFWLTGVGIMLIYTAVSFLLLRRKVATAVRLRDRIYQSEKVASPFVLGIIRPKIYLPFAIDGQNMEYVIAHEMSHIRRRDHLWKPLGFLILTIHWFNPLMWRGYVFLCRDIELACDEKVIKVLDPQQKADYSQALLNCSVNRRIIAACPLAFGEVGIKERVKSVLNYKKPAFWIIVVAIVASIVTAVCFLTDPVKEEEGTEQFFSEGYLFFDIGAESMESIKSCTIIHDGNPTELILSEEDTLLFARYAYTDKVPMPELNEVFTYPKTKRIQIALGDRNVLLYLMQDGRIAVSLPEKGFSMYQAEEQDVITPKKYQQLIAKYTTPLNTPNKDQQSRPTITFRVNSSRPEYTAVVNYSNGSAVTAQSITITDRAAKKDIQTINVSGNELFAEKVLYAADITFDGNLDILIPYERPASAAYFQAYVWQESEGQFVYAPQFENLPNFVIDKENNRILTTRTSSQITSYSISYYDAEAKDFRPSHSIYWEPDASDSKMHFVEQHDINGVTVIVKDCQVEKSSHLDVNKADPQIAEYFAAGSFWDLDSQKWKNQFYNPSQSGTTDGTNPNKGQTIQVAEPFASVLNSTKSFYFENEGKSVLLSDYYKSIWKLASVDIDHGGNKEIAVMFDVDGGGGGTLILWQDGTSVYGYEFGFREMYQLNKDGTFLWNTNSGNTYGCSSIAFEGTKVKTNEVWRVEHDGSGGYTYYVGKRPTTKADVEMVQQIRNSEGVGWTVLGSDTTIVGTAEEWKEPESPYPIQDITDVRVIAGENHQTYRDSYISLNIPLGWKCLEQWGEDGRFLYFRDPIFGENCQLSIYSSGAMHYSHYTREDYMAHFTGYRGYEDVVIDSFSEETIQGFPCTKIVYSYTENNTRFVGIRYDSLNEGPRFYDFAITYPAAESKTYEEEFAAIIESVRFVKSNG